MGLIEHLELYLGEMECGWSRDADGQPMPFQVARFGDPPVPNTVAFSTLGLSRNALRSPVSDKSIHLELLMLVPVSLRDGPVPGVLQQVANELMETGYAVLRGDVIGPRGPLFAGSPVEALYAAQPVYFPDQFAVALEDRLVRCDPDLTDITRASIV